MSFNASIPQSSDIPAESQAQLLTNFGQLDGIFGNNHVTFTAGTDNGKHNFCQMPEQGAVPATAADEGALFTQVGVAPHPTVSELFYRRESNGIEIKMTGFSGTNNAASGAILLPSGLILKWGNGVFSNNDTVTFAASPVFTTVFQIFLQVRTNDSSGTTINDAAYVNDTTITVNDFRVTVTQRTSRTAGSASLSYFAIGV